MKTQDITESFYQTIVLDAIRDEEGQETASVKDCVSFAWDRFQSEVGSWMTQREGQSQAIKHWFQGLALNVPYQNHEILQLAKDALVLKADASEEEEDTFLDRYWARLSMALTQLKVEHLGL